jgi:predicted MFS family arabinose efflux permease
MATDSPALTSRTSETSLLISVIAGFTIATLTANLLPMLIGSLDFGPERAGLIGAIDLGGTAIAAIIVAPFVHRIPLRSFAMLASAVLLAAQLGSIVTDDYFGLMAIRGLAGFAAGIVHASVSAALARVRDPERAYAKMLIGGVVPMALIMAAVPFAIERWGVMGAFGTMAFVVVVALPLLKSIPVDPSVAKSAPTGLESSDHPVLLRGSSLMMLAANFLIVAGFGGLWGFAEQIGLGTGLTREQFGVLVGGTTIIGISGPMLAAWLGTRFGRTLPLVGAVIVSGILAAAMTNSTHPVEFIVIELFWSGLWVFSAPYALGAAATLDPTGRLVAALGGVGMIGMAVGPAIGGWVLSLSDMTTLGLTILATAIVAVLLLFPIVRRLDHA